MNRYIVDGVPMTVVRRETTHSLLRSAGDRTRWVANDLLERFCPADYEQLKSGQIALCVNAAVSERLRRGHAYFGAPPLVVVVGTPAADHSGQVSYNVLGFGCVSRMNKSCFGYKINDAVFCRPCGRDRLDEPRATKVEELHAVSRELKCSRCGTSLGEEEEDASLHVRDLR